MPGWRQTLVRFLKRFDPRQLRDERGRWTSSGGRLAGRTLVRGKGARAEWKRHINATPNTYFAELLNGTDLQVGQLRISVGRSKLAPRALKYTAWLTDRNGNHAGWLTRQFFDDKDDGMPTAYHDHFSLAKRLQGTGAAKQIMRNALAQYGRMGIGRIVTQASLSAGGYTWARFGFLPYGQHIWTYLQPRIRARLYKLPQEDRQAYEQLLKSDDPSTLWLIADSKYGKPLLYKTNYWAKLELGDARQSKRLRAYIRPRS